MSTAYDRLEWKFIEEGFRAFGFNEHWISLILKCISTVSFRVKINGVMSNCFYPQRGIRQGDRFRLSTLIHNAAKGNYIRFESC